MGTSLNQLHPYLYRRGLLKGITNALLGIALIFSEQIGKIFPGLNTQTAQSSQLSYLLPLTFWGVVFLTIGVGIIYGLYRPHKDYHVARIFLRIAFFYALFWFIVLILTMLAGYVRTASVMILWGYFTYNLYLVSTDPGWQAVRLIKDAKLKVEENGN